MLKASTIRKYAFHRFSLAIQILAVILLLHQGCQREEGALLPPYTGRPGELLAVISNELFMGSSGEQLKEIFKRPMEGLPQPEPEFSLNTLPPESFKSTIRNTLNILVVQLDTAQKPGIYFKKSVWAKDQVVASVVGRNDKETAALLADHANELRYFFQKNDRERLVNSLDLNGKLIRWLKSEHGIFMKVPFDYYLAVDTPGFIWMRRETRETSSGLVIMTRPYADTSDFSVESTRAALNKMLQKYIPGPAEGSYMKLVEDYPIEGVRIHADSLYSTELRGLWELENDYMGGPFVCQTRLYPDGDRLVTVMGFVYAPKFKKRDYIINLESILQSFSFQESAGEE
ncbi:MAG: DUF4837 family protein [Flavobacteriales bacterium]|nr:DUF4837 family protein [Flavobacteriales bacterium]